MTTLPTDLPALDVAPGPVRAKPLPQDRPVRWGVIATGKIAHKFVADLAQLEECEVAAVGSRRQESADAFAQTHGIAAAYGDYRSVVEDPDVDVVYIASPHSMHREHVELAFGAGKAVLCEKSLTLNAGDAEVLVAMARDKGLFLMEAMWMRCDPLIRRLQQLVASGALGEVRQVRADLGFVVDKPPTDRLLDPALGAGALLDMGIYPLTFAQLFLGEPTAVAATAGLSAVGRRPRPLAEPRLRERRHGGRHHHHDGLVATHRLHRDEPRTDRPAGTVPPSRDSHLVVVRQRSGSRPARGGPGAQRADALPRLRARGAGGGALPAARRDRESARCPWTRASR